MRVSSLRGGGLAAASLLACSFVVSQPLWHTGALQLRAQEVRSLEQLSYEVVAKQRRGDHDGAVRLAKIMSARVKARFGEGHPQYAMALSNIGLLLDEQTRPYDAEPYYRRAAQILMRDPTRHAMPLGLVMNNLAASVFAQCRLDDAERLYVQALMHLAPAFGHSHPDVAAAHRNLATVRKLLGRGAELATGAGVPRVGVDDPPQDGPRLPAACAA